MARTTLFLLTLALIGPYLYDRYLGISSVLSDRPGKLKSIHNIKQHEVKVQDRIRNCEDVGLAILSCDPGRDRWNTVMGSFHPELGIASGALYIYDYSNPGLSDDEALKSLTLKNFNVDDFHPLGIEFDSPTSTLYVVNHAQSGSAIEVFNLSIKSLTATHIKTFKHPLLHSPNSIHSLGSGKIFFTNDHNLRASLSPLLSKIETWSGIPGGSVIYVDLNDPSTAKTVARVGFANGITMLNSTTLAVASSSKPGVLFYHVTPDYSLQYKGLIRVPAAVDNISVDGKGKLLMAGHAFAPELIKVAKRRAKCNFESEKEEERKACENGAPSWVGEWSEEKGLRELYKDVEYGSSSTAVRDTTRGLGMVVGLYERGVFVFRE
ncbi:putative paraoxonase [Zopfia rhizophila CBS 207.26]|uniref:Putative paraoxonase n=1 Tax=Zopfia rhizophila CBS 207.26 TaxID=1314779 RepID=A0A6A6DDZ2_9PEZI|nr:putative paraoxonase [Zopfia rhizophila CBS 207.26]